VGGGEAPEGGVLFQVNWWGGCVGHLSSESTQKDMKLMLCGQSKGQGGGERGVDRLLRADESFSISGQWEK